MLKGANYTHPLARNSGGSARKAGLTLGAIVIGIAAYGLSLIASPHVSAALPFNSLTPQTVQALNQKTDVNRVIIPEIGVNLEYKTGGEDVLNDYVWHRLPERGNPADGGNFILSAHRFQIGLTHAETVRKSPFFHVDKLQPGDAITVHYEDKVYEYEVEELFRASQYDQTVEAETEDDRLTLYSCGLGGSDDARQVIVARQVTTP